MARDGCAAMCKASGGRAFTQVPAPNVDWPRPARAAGEAARSSVAGRGMRWRRSGAWWQDALKDLNCRCLLLPRAKRHGQGNHPAYQCPSQRNVDHRDRAKVGDMTRPAD